MFQVLSIRIVSAIVFMVLFLVVPWMVDSSYSSIQKLRYTNMDASDFFLYHNITPEKDSYKLGEQITFFSINDTYQPVTYHWNDRLWCDLDNDEKGYHLTGFHQDMAAVEPKIADPDNASPWDFQGTHPEDTGICYLISIVQADVGFDVTKEQRFIGKQFRIVE